jgi:hypothetical protein
MMMMMQKKFSMVSATWLTWYFFVNQLGDFGSQAKARGRQV